MLLLYMITTLFSHRKLDMACLDKLASFLFYMMLVDFSLEGLDFIQRVYQSEESIKILGEMISQRLFISLIVIQLLLGMLLPLIALSAVTDFPFFTGAQEAYLFRIGCSCAVWYLCHTLECGHWRLNYSPRVSEDSLSTK